MIGRGSMSALLTQLSYQMYKTSCQGLPKGISYCTHHVLLVANVSTNQMKSFNIIMPLVEASHSHQYAGTTSVKHFASQKISQMQGRDHIKC